jgi:hypothetical protein
LQPCLINATAGFWCGPLPHVNRRQEITIHLLSCKEQLIARLDAKPTAWVSSPLNLWGAHPARWGERIESLIMLSQGARHFSK